MKKLLLITAIISTLIGCEPEIKETSQLNSYFKNSTIPAAVMGSINKSGEKEWKSFGPSVWDGKDTVNNEHIFRIFSMTKAIASAAALQLVERGVIGLDDPLNKLMPEMTSIPILTEEGELIKSNSPITLRHLLTHTSGFGYEFTSSRLANFKPDQWEYEDLPRLFEPGERWHYGTSTDWVGKVIERLSGQDLETYLRENITGPLGMQSTWFNVPDNLKNKIVSWGMRDSIGFNEFDRVPSPTKIFSGGGGLFSSPKDYLVFLECILNDGTLNNVQILTPESIEMMFKNQLPDQMKINFDLPEGGLPDTVGRFSDETDTFSLAWAIEDSEDEKVRPKGSAYWAGIANSYYTVDKKNGNAVVYFTQFLPFNDKESYDFYRLFEKEVLSN